jgi:hypothetical protein
MDEDKAANLRAFFAKDANSVTRERIFFDRLSFDLKIAAARAGYHLHLYEPDVDRDGFDILAEDEDRVRWYQTKSVLLSAATSSWEIGAGFLWPELAHAEAYGLAPVQAGRGGGVILIEISDQTSKGDISYAFTDYDLISAISEGFLIEPAVQRSGPGRPPESPRSMAKRTLALIGKAKRKAKVRIPRKLFLSVATTDDLLTLIGLQSGSQIGLHAARQAHGGVTIDQAGSVSPSSQAEDVAILHHHMTGLCAMQSSATGYRPFTWIQPTILTPS